jgi:hypothetical protein
MYTKQRYINNYCETKTSVNSTVKYNADQQWRVETTYIIKTKERFFCTEKEK